MNVNHFTQFRRWQDRSGKTPDFANEITMHKQKVVHQKVLFDRTRLLSAFNKALGMAFCMLFSLAAHAQTTEVFNTAGAIQWVVPANVTTINIESWGAQGGDAAGPTAGGLGGYASGDLCVYPGQVINIYVGGAGCEETTGTLGCGGFNGGGDAIGVSITNSRGGGGGASDVRVGGITFLDRVIVAGGGGGACGILGFLSDQGGDGGGLNGDDGQNNTGDSGLGGSQTSGGGSNSAGASPGVFGIGGGPNGNTLGGGGGGWYGGGGGCGAGGGSGYIGGVTNGVMNNGVQSGDGLVQITYDDSEPIANLTCVANLNVVIDADCMVRITPDLVLGGNGNSKYLCNQFYTVVVNGLTPTSAITGNGTSEVLIDASQLDGFFDTGMSAQFEVMVMDPTDNNNMCTNGNWMIVDGYAPDMCCSDYEISCFDPTDPAQLTTGVKKTYAGVGGVVPDPVPGISTVGMLEIPIDVDDCPHAILDLDVVLNIDHDFMANYAAELESPDGNFVISLFDQPANGPGCLGEDLEVTFSDQATNPLTCSPGVAPSYDGEYQPLVTLSTLNTTPANGTWILRILNYDDPISLGSVVTAELIIEANYAYPIVTDCSQVITTYTDNPIDPSLLDICNGQPIIRTWTSTDAKGKTATCSQTITVTRPALGDIDCPEDITYSCTAEVPEDPNNPGHPDPAHTGEPTYEGIPVSGLCMYLVSYEDSYSSDDCNELFMRTWKITDMCSNPNGFIFCMQSIKISDDEGPDFTAPDDVTISPPYFTNCLASHILPAPSITDVCSPNNNLTYVVIPDPSGGVLTNNNGTYTYSNLEVGNSYTVTYIAFDGCGNSSSDDFTITVIDGIAPTPVCGPNTTTLNNQGLAKIFANTFGAASHDNCGIINYQIRRIADCATPANISFGDFVEFQCCDASQDVAVELYVEDAAGNSNTVICTVTVSPYPGFGFSPCPDPNGGILECNDLSGLDPPFFGVTSTDTGIPVTYTDKDGNVSDAGDYYYITTGINSSACSDIAVTIVDAADLSTCGVGSVTRTYTVTAGSQEATCTVNYTVVNSTIFDLGSIQLESPTVVMCDDVDDPSNPLSSELPLGAQEPTFDPAPDDACQNIQAFPGDDDDVYPTSEFGVCYKIFRYWEIWDECSLTLYDEDDSPKLKQLIKVMDIEPPVLSGCPDDIVEVGDGGTLELNVSGTDNCGGGASTMTYTIDYGNNGSVDLTNGTGGDINEEVGGTTSFTVGEEHLITFTATSNCNVTSTCTVIVSVIIDPCLVLTDDQFQVNVGYDIDGGEIDPLEHDDPDLYVDGVGYDATDVKLSYEEFGNQEDNLFFDCDAVFDNQETPVTIYIHLVNGAVCPREIHVEDGSPPTIPQCPTSQSLFPLQADEATDMVDFATAPFENLGQSEAEYYFDNDIFDNCTKDITKFTFAYDPPTYDCGGSTGNDIVQVDITIFDEAGNSEGCNQVDVPVFCGSIPPLSAVYVNGAISNEENAMLENVAVTPASGMDIVMTDVNGAFDFDLPVNENYDITPEKDDDHLNGVSTYDIVLISKHILGIELLDSPYKLISADVNNSGGITTLDMVELRKVILFINDEFPNNTSWRFVDADYVFTNPSNPFAEAFPESYSVNGLTSDVSNLDFVAAKTGDINCSATTSGLMGSADDRDFDGALLLEMKEAQLAAGQTHTIEVKAKDFNELLGYQFTLAFEGLEVLEVQPGELPGMTTGNFGMQRLPEGILTTSWNNSTAVTLEDGAVLFSLVVKAKDALTLSNVLHASSRYTAAEAYADKANTIELLDVNLSFRSEAGIQVAEQFELYQNRPNPFKEETVIGFDLPQSGVATVRVYDLSGRVLTQIEDSYQRGYNEVSINRSDLPATGVLYYELTTGSNSAIRKMTIIE